jgi:hypothetical protein
MRYLEGHGNVSGRSEQANPLPVTISIASRRLAHLSVAAEKNSVKPRPSISKRCRIGARLLNRCARHMTGGRWLTLVDLVANSIPFCEVRVLSPFAFCACKRAWAADHPAIAQGLRIYRSRGVCRRSAAVGAFIATHGLRLTRFARRRYSRTGGIGTTIRGYNVAVSQNFLTSGIF